MDDESEWEAELVVLEELDAVNRDRSIQRGREVSVPMEGIFVERKERTESGIRGGWRSGGGEGIKLRWMERTLSL